MKTLLTILILISSGAVFGQTKTFTIETNQNGDTSFWFKYQDAIIKDLALFRLDTVTSNFHFRVWKSNQVLDVWQNRDSSYSAQLTSWVFEISPVKETPTDRILVDRKTYDKETGKKIFDFIVTSGINKLPTDNLIAGWKQGFDGETYIIEFAIPTAYSFKTYWTPSVQDSSLQEAKFIETFVDNIFEMANGKTTWRIFETTIPYECYKVGGTIRCRILTKRQKRKYAKERRSYRQQKYL